MNEFKTQGKSFGVGEMLLSSLIVFAIATVKNLFFDFQLYIDLCQHGLWMRLGLKFV